MNSAEVAERGAELVERINDELGEDWTKRPGIAGVDKGLVVWGDGTVALASKEWAFYLIDDELWNRLRRADSIVTGRWHEGEFQPTAVTDAPDPSQN